MSPGLREVDLSTADTEQQDTKQDIKEEAKEDTEEDNQPDVVDHPLEVEREEEEGDDTLAPLQSVPSQSLSSDNTIQPPPQAALPKDNHHSKPLNPTSSVVSCCY